MNSKPRIVVTCPIKFLPDQILRLERLGDVTYFDTLPSSPNEWMKRTENAQIICSNKYGLTEKIYDRKNVFYSLPFVAVQWIDKEKLKASGNTVSYNPGCNRYAVSEWIVSMTLSLMRKFYRLVNTETLIDKTGSADYFGLAMKKACILGKGSIGKIVGNTYEALGVHVGYFNRGDNLIEKTKGCDIVVNTLSSNTTTNGLLNKAFFDSFTGKTFFITITSSKVYDQEAMLAALQTGKLLGVADDCGSILPGDYDDSYYKKLAHTERVLATPHISYQSDVTVKMANDMMIDNIEAWINGKPTNLLVKKD